MRRDRLLLAAIGANAALGAGIVLAPALARQGFSLMIFGDAGQIDAFAPDARAYVTLVHGVMGAVMIAWSVALASLLRGRWRTDGATARGIVARSIGVWFVVDSLHSALAGAWPNVALNCGFAALFALALWRARDPQPGTG
jgi:hypothetical protein